MAAESLIGIVNDPENPMSGEKPGRSQVTDCGLDDIQRVQPICLLMYPSMIAFRRWLDLRHWIVVRRGTARFLRILPALTVSRALSMPYLSSLHCTSNSPAFRVAAFSMPEPYRHGTSSD